MPGVQKVIQIGMMLSMLFMILGCGRENQQAEDRSRKVHIRTGAGHREVVVMKDGVTEGYTPLKDLSVKKGDYLRLSGFEYAGVLNYIIRSKDKNELVFSQRGRSLLVNGIPFGRIVSPHDSITDQTNGQSIQMLWFVDRPSENEFKTLERIEQLKILNFAEIPLKNADLDDMNDLPLLQVLSLVDTDITDQGLAYLKKCPSLEHLSVTGNEISNNGLSHLGEMTTLESLRLTDTEITDTGLHHLQSLTELKALYLNETQISGKGLDELGQKQSLQALSMKKTQISNDGLQFLKLFPSLRVLSLFETDISHKGLSHLTSLQ
jgi:Leucine-rich repeat (LRR) protein